MSRFPRGLPDVPKPGDTLRVFEGAEGVEVGGLLGLPERGGANRPLWGRNANGVAVVRAGDAAAATDDGGCRCVVAQAGG